MTADDDTPRGHLLLLARRKVRFPDVPVVDEVALASTVVDRAERDGEFAALCEAVSLGEPDRAARCLDHLTGGAR